MLRDSPEGTESRKRRSRCRGCEVKLGGPSFEWETRSNENKLDVSGAASHAWEKISQEDDAITRRLLMLNCRQAANDDRSDDESDDTAECSRPVSNEERPHHSAEEKQHDG